MPRLVGQLVSYLPLVDVAVPFALAGAGIAALCALFIYHAMDGWIRSPWLRALVGAALILLPLAPIEIADSTVGCPWYALAALFFGLLGRPKNWAGMSTGWRSCTARRTSQPQHRLTAVPHPFPPGRGLPRGRLPKPGTPARRTTWGCSPPCRTRRSGPGPAPGGPGRPKPGTLTHLSC